MIQKRISLMDIYSEIANAWHYAKNGYNTPKGFRMHSCVKGWWTCLKNHEWIAIIAVRSKGKGCRYCSGRKVIKGYTDLATVYPELAKEWHPTKNEDLTPDKVNSKSDQKAWWICGKGHVWKDKIGNRSGGNGCPCCSRQRVIKGENDLATINPKLASEWHPKRNKSLTPKDVFANSNKKVWWICNRDHMWKASIFNRNKGTGCPYCAGNRPILG